MKIFSNKFLRLIVISAIFFAISASSVSAATYYVKNGGNNNADGLSPANAWATIGKLNTFNFASGDIINFRPGDVFNDTNLKLLGVTGTIAVTIQGSDFDGRTIAANGKPKFDADAIVVQWNADKSLAQPGAISINNSAIPGTISSITIKNLQFEGQTPDEKLDWIAFYNVYNITVDGVDGNGAGGGNYAAGGNDGISVWYGTPASSGDIEIKNCHLENLGPAAVTSSPTKGAGDVYALYVTSKTGGTVSIHNNLIHNINADAIQMRAVFSDCATNIYDNEFYNLGENGVDIKASDNFNVYHNNIYRTSGFSGPGGVPGGQFPAIQIIPNTEVTWHNTADNNNIYENYLHDIPGAGGYGVVVGTPIEGNYATGNKIHHNYIRNTYSGINHQAGGIGTRMYGNVIIDSSAYGYWENNSQSGNIFNNNTVVNHASMGMGLRLEYSNATVKNNLVYQTDSGDLALTKTAGTPTLDYNIYYNATAGGQNLVAYGATTYTETQQSTWNSLGHSHDIFGNPGLQDVPNNSLWAAAGSSAIVNAGLPSTGQLWDLGLKSVSTWTPRISIISTSGSANGGRDIGAFEYQPIEDVEPPVSDNLPPAAPMGLSVN